METRRPRKKKKSKRMTRRRRYRIISQYILLLLCALLALGITYMVLRRYVNKTPENKICNHVFIGTTDVSGLTAKETQKKLKEQYEKDLKLEITFKVNKKSEKLTLEELGFKEADFEKLAKEAVEYGKEGSVWTRYRKIKRLEKENYVIKPKYKIDEKVTKELLDEKVDPLVKGAKDATIKRSGDGFKISEAKEGKAIDTEACIVAVEEHLKTKWNHKAFSIEVPTKKESPRIVKEDLKDIKDNLGSFFTYAGGGERWNNLKNGVDKINGTILMPGDKLSVYEATAPYTEENGYYQAGAYAGGEVIAAYGGGICQVSTTLYNAAIYAELDILARNSHTMTVPYVEPSRDAAIAEETLDLVIQNNLKYPVYIYGEINEENELRFIVYGKETRDKGRTIEFESETLKEEEPGVEYRENPNLYIGDKNYAGDPHTGKEARLWKVVYQDGKEVEREVFNNSSYQKSNQIVEIGTKSDNASATVLVREAIGSNDPERIQNAINAALGM